MSEPTNKETTKAAKKFAKAQAKALKKGAVGSTQPPYTSSEMATGNLTRPSEPTAAERSARAAERQVLLHGWRLIVSILGLIVALISLFLSLDLWRR